MAIAEERARHPKTPRKKTPWSVDRLADSEFMRIRMECQEHIRAVETSKACALGDCLRESGEGRSAFRQNYF